MSRLALCLCLAATPVAHAQWDIQTSGTTADLRGIASVGKGIAWASGTNGTVLRTEDGGYLWQHCITPPGAEILDFRGIQAFDANTAIVMSSGKGDLSRLYKTIDGCQTWKLLATNRDPDGFFDALMMSDLHNGWLLSDPVDGSFVVDSLNDNSENFGVFRRTGDNSWRNGNTYSNLEAQGRASFAASNSSLVLRPFGQRPNPCSWNPLWFGTSGPSGALVFWLQSDQPQCSDYGLQHWEHRRVPVTGSNHSSGIFSLALRSDFVLVAVGGDYERPDDSLGSAASSMDGGKNWQAATTPPHGFRSAVAYDAPTKTWITVGPNGTDISRDDGRNWHPLKPGPSEPTDADQHWNALSLPFVVGPKGRIGILRALNPASK